MLTVVTWTVALSVYAHGLTAWPGANRYADWYTAHSADHPSMPESVPAPSSPFALPPFPAGAVVQVCARRSSRPNSPIWA